MYKCVVLYHALQSPCLIFEIDSTLRDSACSLPICTHAFEGRSASFLMEKFDVISEIGRRSGAWIRARARGILGLASISGPIEID